MSSLLEIPGVSHEVATFVRAGLALAIACGLVLGLGRWTIERLRNFCRDTNASPSQSLRQLHAAKRATPSMGGLLIIAAFFVALAVCGSVTDPRVILAAVVALGMGTIGAVDDLAKSRTHGRGLSRRQKLISQTMVAALVAVGLDTYLNTTPNPWFIAISSVVLIATSNAVNLTDGLDGLAAGCASWAGAGLAVVAWLSVAEDPSFGEIVVIASSLVGASLGFVRFNRWPAQMFMGDTGALALGGVLGYLAIVSQHQGLWMLVGAVFIVETLSVIVQIAWFRATGRRVLRCAPLHHHFQFMGWPEPTIVRRLCAVAAVCALTAVGLSHLTHHRAQTSVQSMAAAHVQHPVR